LSQVKLNQACSLMGPIKMQGKFNQSCKGPRVPSDPASPWAVILTPVGGEEGFRLRQPTTPTKKNVNPESTPPKYRQVRIYSAIFSYAWFCAPVTFFAHVCHFLPIGIVVPECENGFMVSTGSPQVVYPPHEHMRQSTGLTIQSIYSSTLQLK